MLKYKGLVMYDPNNKNFKKELESRYPEYELVSKEVSGETKYIKTCKIKYLNKKTGKEIPFELAERPTKVTNDKNENLVIPDAVSALTYFVEDGRVYFVLANQFRFPIGRREISLFAGLVDKEDFKKGIAVEKGLLNSVKRELGEESGATIKKVMPISGVMAKSAGFSNETEKIYLAEIDLGEGKTNLEKDEDIFSIIVPAEYIGEFLEEFQNDISIVLQCAFTSALALPKCKAFINESSQSESESE